MIDKRENNDFMTDFVFMNYSPNRRIIDDQQPIDDFGLRNCYFCISFFEYLIPKKKMAKNKSFSCWFSYYMGH